MVTPTGCGKSKKNKDLVCPTPQSRVIDNIEEDSSMSNLDCPQKKTAGEFSSLTSGHSLFENVSKKNSITVPPSDAILAAAKWYLANQHDHSERFTPKIMKKFNLKPKQVVKAYLLAEKIQVKKVNIGGVWHG
jgi:hypothetical protein